MANFSVVVFIKEEYESEIQGGVMPLLSFEDYSIDSIKAEVKKMIMEGFFLELSDETFFISPSAIKIIKFIEKK